MAEPVRQQVTISVDENGRLIIEPNLRDLYRNEEVEWVCAQDEWEVLFNEDEEQEVTPFDSELFGPGMDVSIGVARADLPDDELPTYLTGKYRRAVSDGLEFSYTARVRGFNPRSGRVRIFRGARPN